MVTTARETAYTVLLDIEKNNTFSNIALSNALRKNQFADKKDRAFVTRMVEGVTELRLRLDFIINKYSKTRVNRMKPAIRVIIRMGVYQLLYMDSVPDRAAINESVKLAKSHGFSSLSGFVNGVLRSVAAADNYAKEMSPDIYYSVPEWLCDFLKENYGDDAEKILAAQFEDRGTTIRCNRTKISPDALSEKISAAGISVAKGIYDENALIIDNYDFIRKVPGYRNGEFSVQDESSMCAVSAAMKALGEKGSNYPDRDILVLDMCAAPGGKSLYAAEILKSGHRGNESGDISYGIKSRIISRDISKDKTDLIRENAERLGLDNIVIEEYDALTPDIEMTERADLVIADVPCSGLGIIGKKNDIKYRVTREDMTALSDMALKILNNAALYLKPGGVLLFSTCTINPEENNLNAERLLSEHKELKKLDERLFVQGRDSCDGFYYCIIKKCRTALCEENIGPTGDME